MITSIHLSCYYYYHHHNIEFIIIIWHSNIPSDSPSSQKSSPRASPDVLNPTINSNGLVRLNVAKEKELWNFFKDLA